MTQGTQKLLALTLVFLLAIALVGGVADSLFEYRSLPAAVPWRTQAQTRAVLADIDAMLSQLKDAETGQRGFLLTGDPAYLEPYTASLGPIEAAKTRLGAAAARDPERLARLAVLVDHVSYKLDELRSTIAARKDRGLDAALEDVKSGRGKRAMDEARALTDAMRGTEQRRLGLQTLYQNGLTMVCLGTALAVALVGAWTRVLSPAPTP